MQGRAARFGVIFSSPTGCVAAIGLICSMAKGSKVFAHAPVTARQRAEFMGEVMA
jgi:hypothetical protein